jgi:hypothetical protein
MDMDMDMMMDLIGLIIITTIEDKPEVYDEV